jgi:quercetin dioxygenase-like cupin family protein
MEVAERQGYALREGAAITEFWWLGGKMAIKAGVAQTERRFSQLVLTDPRGTASPVHVHAEAWESFYVLRGELSLFLGDERIEAGAGDYALLPPGIPHAYLIRSDGTQALVTVVPAGTEAFFTELGVPVTPAQSEPPAAHLDPEEFARRARPYGIEIVGPPPTLE